MSRISKTLGVLLGGAALLTATPVVAGETAEADSSSEYSLESAATAPAYAQGSSGKELGNVQIKILGTVVLPDGEITSVITDNLGLPAGSQTAATDSVIPSVAVEYFISDNFSLETICCLTPHEVDGRGALAGAEAIQDILILPATLTAKYHFTGIDGVRPYVGVGPTYFFFIGEEPGSTLEALGATRQTHSDEFGVAFQAGFDVDLNDKGLVATVDVKRFLVSTTATWFDAGGNVLLQTEHDIDPWVLSAGIGFRF